MSSNNHSDQQGTKKVEYDLVPTLALSVIVLTLVLSTVVAVAFIWNVLNNYSSTASRTAQAKQENFIVNAVKGTVTNVAEYRKNDQAINTNGGKDKASGVQIGAIALAMDRLVKNPDYVSKLPNAKQGSLKAPAPPPVRPGPTPAPIQLRPTPVPTRLAPSPAPIKNVKPVRVPPIRRSKSQAPPIAPRARKVPAPPIPAPLRPVPKREQPKNQPAPVRPAPPTRPAAPAPARPAVAPAPRREQPKKRQAPAPDKR